jgi:septum site-determining protein MinD
MLAIAGGKGGCGKTTTTLGVARALARNGHDPLVIDADSDMPDVHHVAGVPRDPCLDELAEGASLESLARTTETFPGVGLLTAGRRERLDGALSRAQSWRGPVLVDCPPGSGPDAVRPLRYADAALVVTTDEPAPLDDAARTVRAVRQLDTRPAGVVTVRRTRRGAPSAVAGCPVLASPPFATEPFDDQRVGAAWRQVAAHVTDHTEAHAPTLPA